MNSYIFVKKTDYPYLFDGSDILPFVIRANNFVEAEEIFNKMKIPDIYGKFMTSDKDVRIFEAQEITSI